MIRRVIRKKVEAVPQRERKVIREVMTSGLENLKMRD